MWLKWLPWKYMVRYVARRKGFIDPIALLARLDSFAQPAATRAPVELLRAGAVLHARGFINNNVIQHNLDWVWPLWVRRQFDPRHPAFIPRAFSMTHINLTQRNWTAVGYPGCAETPIVDARGLLMPFFDSWSLDAWFVGDDGRTLVPSRAEGVTQRLETAGNLRVVTEAAAEGMRLRMAVEAIVVDGEPVCRMDIRAESDAGGWLALALRPYNPEGISFVNDLSLLAGATGWEINKEHAVRFSHPPHEHLMSHYHDGDVFTALRAGNFNLRPHVTCEVGMATGAALYRVPPGGVAQAFATVPLVRDTKTPPVTFTAREKWDAALVGTVPLSGGEGRFRFLYDAAVRTVVLLSPEAIYAGPYTYKRFWYRDAAIIVHALMCAGHRAPSERALDYCVRGQTHAGYFKSQEGEWDSNGQVLWAMGRYCRLFNATPKPAWVVAIRKAVRWIRRKRVVDRDAPGRRHDGLLPAGFSAEHLGPNDFYYWDDFWSIAGLRLAAEMLEKVGGSENEAAAEEALSEAESLSRAVDNSLALTAAKLGTSAMPASPYRRLDSGAVGSVAAAFPLQLWPRDDERTTATLDYLRRECLILGAFYHDISHSGINPYLSLHIAQGLLREGRSAGRDIMKAVAALASPTGQWPEAIHPQLGTGCMGDGQHAWAAGEWIMMVRNCFFFEEEYEDVLVVGAGLSESWCIDGEASFGPAPTRFGPVTASLTCRGDQLELSWSGEWFGEAPRVEVRFPSQGMELVDAGLHRRIYRFTSNREGVDL
ncbi:MAG TPA: hypothetical protein VHO02_07085 [Fibrobacteria bacterium]|nr:hypothetical protein [Fibrobacteria bacterium]